MSYPFKWQQVSSKLEDERQKLYDQGSTNIGAVVSEPLGVHAPPPMSKIAEKIYNFKVRPDDIWIVTYPKCGTTWTQELVWQIVHKVDIDTAKKVSLFARSPFIEMEGLLTEEMIKERKMEYTNEADKMMANSIEITETLPSPRIIKTHLPMDMLPPDLIDTCKVIFVCRNPKDCCVSYYHHYLNIPKYKFKGSFEDFANCFMDGTLELGNYWTMLKSAWKLRDHPNMKILWFEDMKKDLISVIKDVSKYIGYHMTELKVLELDDHLFVDNFRKIIVEGYGGAPKMKKFVRKGQVGDWKNYFTEENCQIWDDWIKRNLHDTDIILPDH